MTEHTFIDLFSGAGLFSAGLMQAGLRPVFAMDLAADAIASYRRNVADCAVQGSVADFQGAPKADLLIAGPPCQGFSTLGRRDPTDVRNDLCLAIIPWIKASDPNVVVLENVPPFLRSAQWQSVVGEMRELGYRDVMTWELDAVDYGAPQRRRRAFTVASRIGHIDAPVPASASVAAGTVIFADIPADDPMHTWPIAKGIAEERIQLIPPKGDKRDLLRDHPKLCPPSWEKVGNNATDVWGRIDPDQPSNTIRCTFQNPSKGRYLHPSENRTISLREGARLQGVPDHWVFEGRPYPIARQIGNGVPIPLARAVGATLALALGRLDLAAAA